MIDALRDVLLSDAAAAGPGGEAPALSRPVGSPASSLRAATREPGARAVQALTLGEPFVVLNGLDGFAETRLPELLGQLRGAGFATAHIAAPISPVSRLFGAIRDALTGEGGRGRTLVVLVLGAERLSAATVLRLVGLSMLQRDGRPVMRFLLAGRAGLWPVLHEAGLGSLEGDAAADIRLPPRRVQEHRRGEDKTVAASRAAAGQDRSRKRLTSAAGLAVSMGAAIAVYVWMAPSRPHDQPPRAAHAPPAPRQAPPVAPPPRAEPGPPAAIAPSAAPSRAAPAPSRAAPAAARPLPAPAPPSRTSEVPKPPTGLPATARPDEALDGLETIHVSLRYQAGDAAARAAAQRLGSRLDRAGVAAAPPAAVAHLAHSSLAYNFLQDGQAARRLARLLPMGVPVVRQPMKPLGAPPRPGEIAISIGADLGPALQAERNQTGPG